MGMEVLLTDFDSAQPKTPTENSGSDAGDDDEHGISANDKEDLNELLSNNETDYLLYSSIDEQLAEDGIEQVSLFTSHDEVPDWIKYPNGKQKSTSQPDSSDGARKRKTVAYD